MLLAAPPRPAALVIHPQRFEGRVAVVTGGAGAFGTAITDQLSAEGANVVVADLDLDGASRDPWPRSATGSHRSGSTSPTQSRSPRRWRSPRPQVFGAVDVLVNNAGLTHRITPLDELPDEALRPRVRRQRQGHVPLLEACDRWAAAERRLARS